MLVCFVFLYLNTAIPFIVSVFPYLFSNLKGGKNVACPVSEKTENVPLCPKKVYFIFPVTNSLTPETPSKLKVSSQSNFLNPF